MTVLLELLLLSQTRGVAAQPNAQQPSADSATPAQDQAPGGVPTVQDLGDSLLMQFDEAGDSISLEWLTKLVQQQTSKNFVYDGAVASALATTQVKMLGPKRIEKSKLYDFYQNLMFINNFTCTNVGRGDTSVVLVQQSGAAGGRPAQGQIKSELVFVEASELDQYAGQVATQIMTVLHLPHIDVRQLQNNIRQLVQDASVNAIPVGNSNSVILAGSGSQVSMHARILKLVDDETAKESDLAPAFDIIKLEFASGKDVADMLDQLLEAQRRATQQQRAGQAQGATAPLQGAGQESKIIVDSRTNSLIVMAMAEDMVRIKELVAQLDVEVVEPERTYHIYMLDNVKAEDLAEVLEDFIQDSSRVSPTGAAGRAVGGGEGGGAQGRSSSASENEVVVVPDPATNSLLIAAGKTRYEEVLDLIRQLDRRHDQVLIETALVELSGRNFRDLGVELGFADIPGSGTGGFGLTSFGLSTLADTDDDGIPDVRVPNLTDGITAGILDGDDFGLPVLLRAVQNLRDSNVLNVPSVLVNNNGSAKVSTLDEQPKTTVTLGGAGVGGTQTNFAGYEQAGITMQISPSISASGYLRLNIYLEVSKFLGAFQGDIPPPRITRTLDTTINVPNGDTMVIGGIITDDKTHTRNQTPLLGDLPILGYLFSRDSNTYERTTLYFFVTPHILRDKDFADLAEYSYKVKLNASEVIGAARIQVVDPNFKAKQPGAELEGFDVPLYRSPRRGEVDPSAVGLDPVKQAELLKSTSEQPSREPTPPAADDKP